MAVDTLTKWQQELKNLPASDNPVWATNFANWYFDRISAAGAVDGQGLFADPASLVPTTWVFTFDKATFVTQLQPLPQTDDALTGITNFANAWEAAMLTSTISVAPGTFIPPSSPPTLFSVVASAVFDPPSIAVAKALIQTLVTAPPTDDAETSEFAEKFRDATLSLTVTVSGTNSVAPTPGPLVAAAVPLV